MATFADILSPQDRIAALANEPSVTTGILAGLTDGPSAVPGASPGPGPIGLQPHSVASLRSYAPPVTPRTPVLASRNVYGPSRIQGEMGGGGRPGMASAAGDPGLAAQMTRLATSPDGAPTGWLAGRTGQAVRAGLYALGQNLPPTARGLTGVLGSAGRTFTSTVDALQAQRAQQAEAQQAQQQQAFTQQQQQGQLGLLGAQTAAYQSLAQQRTADADAPGKDPNEVFVNQPGQPAGFVNLLTHTFTPIGRLPARPTGNAGGLDPLSKEFDSLLTKVEGERFGGLPAYQTPDAQYAEAVRRMQARHPNWRPQGGGAPSTGGSAPATQQQRDWDAAAAAIQQDTTGRYRGQTAAQVLGPRP